jgi:hypothetical protein
MRRTENRLEELVQEVRSRIERYEATNRFLHLSRFAMLSAVVVASAISSLSQRRPRAIDATNVARVSDRIGRACCGGIASGARIPRRRVDVIFFHGTWRAPVPTPDVPAICVEELPGTFRAISTKSKQAQTSIEDETGRL